ncbi:MAG: ADP-ribosylation factor-like protein [Candidatus Lokiarchaeia archaeon]|nr:ADP-ribosylation factor-like protein [Candidatus Lokiarchaeia archaeon]
MSESKNFKKILFCGLESGGKTSILLLLDKKFSLLASVKPTIKAKRTFYTNSLLGTTIVRWDLGGQKGYRKVYLGDKSKYFTEMQSIFYVIDIQAPKKFEEALTFLKDIIYITSESRPENFQLLILLHKCDPDIKNNTNIINNIKFLENEITSIIKEVKYSILKTSIYDEPSLLKAFSDGVFYATHRSKMFQTLLKDYMGKTYNSSTLLLDQNCFIIASRSTDQAYQEICEAIAPRLTQALEKLEEWDINTIDIVTNIEFPEKQSESQKEGIIFLRKLDIEDTRLYLVALCLNKNVKIKSYEYLPLLAENLKNLLETFD